MISLTPIVPLVSVAIYGYWLYKKPLEQNKYLLIITTIIMFILGVKGIVSDTEKHNAVTLFTYLYESVLLLALTITYIARYNEHKEAGLMDAPKN